MRLVCMGRLYPVHRPPQRPGHYGLGRFRRPASHMGIGTRESTRRGREISCGSVVSTSWSRLSGGASDCCKFAVVAFWPFRMASTVSMSFMY